MIDGKIEPKMPTRPVQPKANFLFPGGALGRFRRLRETAFQYAFILDLAGIKN